MYSLARLVVIAACVAGTTLLQSQVALGQELNIPSMPAPTVASIARYTDFPEVDQYGLAPVNIPIYTLKVKGLALPIALNYHPSGIRVGQESTWVGLGFDLQAGGFITRSVKDLPDDIRTTRNLTTDQTAFTNRGWLSTPGFYQDFPNLAGAVGSDEESRSANILAQNDGSSLMTDRHDMEPDIYYINIGNVREKFTFDHSGQVVFLEPQSKLLVTYQPITNLSKGIREFVVTDPDGNKYYFGSVDENDGEVEWTTVKMKYYGSPQPRTYGAGLISFSWNAGGVETRSFRTTWFIRKIIVQENGQQINFTYTDATEQFDLPIDQYYIKTSGTSDPANPKPILYNLWAGLKSVNHSVQTKYLQGITAGTLSASFQLSNRTDLNGAKKLDRVTVTGAGQILEQADFSYSTIRATGSGDDFVFNRLYLNTVKLQGKPPYVFFYNSTDLPDKQSVKQDLWGFPCDKSTGLIPKIYVFPSRTDYVRYSCFFASGSGVPVVLDGSDRTVDLTSVMKGSLRRVKLPTGGYDEFIYESNDFVDAAWGEIQGGGLRIKEIRKLNQFTQEIQRKSYSYKNGLQSSGTLINMLAFAAPTTYSIPDSDTKLYQQDPTNWDAFTLRRSSNFVPLGNLDGPLVAYTKVTVSETSNGKIEREYYPAKNFLTHATPVKWAKPYISTNSLKTSTNTLVQTRYTKTINLKDYNLSTTNQNVTVPVYEEVKGTNWNPNGVSSNQIRFFFYNASQAYEFKPTDMGAWAISFLFSHDEGNVPLGQVQKTGFNIFPYPPISDDGAVNVGKLKEIRTFAEGASTPQQTTTYTYKAVGTPVNIYGISYATEYVCNIVLTPLPIEIDYVTNYSYNAQYFIQENLRIYVMPRSWAKYKLVAAQATVIDTETITLDGRQKITQYNYNSNLFNKEIIQTSGTGNVIKTKFKYADDYPVVNAAGGINLMKAVNVVSKFIEKEVTLTRGATTSILSAELNDYRALTGSRIVLSRTGSYRPVAQDLTPMNSTIASTGELNPDGRYRILVSFTNYDANANVIQYNGANKVTKSLIWGYGGVVPIAQVENAPYTQISHTSFETDDDLGGLTYSSTTPGFYNTTDAKTGTRSWYLYSGSASHNVTRGSIPAGTYRVTYWAKGTGGVKVHTGSVVPVTSTWAYYEATVTAAAPTTFSLVGSGTSVLIDEVRIYPASSFLTTYTHNPYVGITSITDANGVVQYYQYDTGNRLKLTQIDNADGTKSIINHFLYNYMDQ